MAAAADDYGSDDADDDDDADDGCVANDGRLRATPEWIVAVVHMGEFRPRPGGSNGLGTGTSRAMNANDRIEPGRPKAADVHENVNAGDAAMEDDLTEEREPTPEQKAETSDDIALDP